jgi:hypothetical protein
MSENKPKTKRKAPATAFKPGKSGNPGGRPKLPEDIKNVREMARQYTSDAVEALVKVMRTSNSDAARVAAVNALLDRGWGKAAQPLTGEGGEGPVQTINRIELVALSGNGKG